MIGNLSYEEIENIIKTLEISNSNLKKILDYYQSKTETGTMRIERFNMELENYINYLKKNKQIYKDADIAVQKIRELNS